MLLNKSLLDSFPYSFLAIPFDFAQGKLCGLCEKPNSLSSAFLTVPLRFQATCGGHSPPYAMRQGKGLFAGLGCFSLRPSSILHPPNSRQKTAACPPVRVLLTFYGIATPSYNR